MPMAWLTDMARFFFYSKQSNINFGQGCYQNNKDSRNNSSNALAINLELQVFMSSTIISSHEQPINFENCHFLYWVSINKKHQIVITTSKGKYFKTLKDQLSFFLHIVDFFINNHLIHGCNLYIWKVGSLVSKILDFISINWLSVS